MLVNVTPWDVSSARVAAVIERVAARGSDRAVADERRDDGVQPSSADGAPLEGASDAVVTQARGLAANTTRAREQHRAVPSTVAQAALDVFVVRVCASCGAKHKALRFAPLAAPCRSCTAALEERQRLLDLMPREQRIEDAF